MESVIDNQVKAIKRDQAELISKMKNLLSEYQIIAKNAPTTDLDAGCNRINIICDRLDKTKKRISIVNKRAEVLLSILASKEVSIGQAPEIAVNAVE